MTVTVRRDWFLDQGMIAIAKSAVRTARVPCCTENHCSATCPMGLSPYREGRNLLCTNYGRCIDACPRQRLRFKGF